MSFTAVGSNAPLLKRQNRTAVLRGVLSAGPLSRRALCRKTGLTASTITQIVGELIAAGLIRELGVAEPGDGPARVGRREVLIDLEPLGGVVVGGHIGLQRTVLGVGDLRGGLVSSVRFSTQAEQGPSSVVQRIAAEVPGLLERAGVGPERILGLGIGIVGPVDVGQGTPSSSPELGWRDVPLRSLLQDAIGLPTVVDSGRRGMALAEMMFGIGQGVPNFMLVHVGSTIVAGIVSDQQLYRGAHGDGGSIGHLAIAGVTGVAGVAAKAAWTRSRARRPWTSAPGRWPGRRPTRRWLGRWRPSPSCSPASGCTRPSRTVIPRPSRSSMDAARGSARASRT